MNSTVLASSTRTFGAGLFAVVAFVTASFFTLVLMGFVENRSVLALLPLPLLAALCAYAWAWVLYPAAGAPSYGSARGLSIALLAYLSFAAVFSFYLDWVQPPSPAGMPHVGGQMLLVAFVLTPFPWAALVVGALAGRVHLTSVRPRIGAATRRCSTTAARAGTAARAVYIDLAARTANPTLLPALTMIVSNGLLLAGTAFGFLVARVGPASSGHYDDPSLLVFPVCIALGCGALGWLLGRWAVAHVAAQHRLLLLLASTGLAGWAGVLFVLRVA